VVKVDFTQDRAQWCTLVTRVMNLQVAYKVENFLIKMVLASQGFCFIIFMNFSCPFTKYIITFSTLW
jgi:hypothetical protein